MTDFNNAGRSAGRTDSSSRPSGDPKKENRYKKTDTGRPPYRKRTSDSGKPPYRKRTEDGDSGKPPYRKRSSDSGKPPYRKRTEDGDSGRPPYRKRNSDSDKPPYRKRTEDGDSGRPPYRKRSSDSGKPPYRKRTEDGGSEKPWGDRRSSGTRKPFRKREGDQEKHYDNRRSSDTRKPFRKREGDQEKRYDDRRSSDTRKPFRKREGDQEKRYDDRRSSDTRKPFRKREGDQEKRYDDRRSSDTRKPFRKREGDTEKHYNSKKEYTAGSRGSRKKYSPDKNYRRDNKRGNSATFRKTGEKHDGEIRLNRYIASTGRCSRRQADDFIKAGVVSVNGKTVTEMGIKVKPDDVVKLSGETIRPEAKVYILMNKPKDYITTTDDPQERKIVMDLLDNDLRSKVFPVGRLDRNTTGVLLLTNDGDMARRLLHPSMNKKKIYHVFLDKNFKTLHVDQLLEGIELEDGPIRADAVQYADETDKSQVGIELHSGKNHIVKRMFEYLGYNVIKLDRVYFAGLTKKGLERGKWRMLSEREINMLKIGAFD